MTVISREAFSGEESVSPFLTELRLPPREPRQEASELRDSERWIPAAECALEWVLAHYDADVLSGVSPDRAARSTVERFSGWIEVSLSGSVGAVPPGEASLRFQDELDRWEELAEECVEEATRDLASVDRYLALYLLMARHVVEQGYGFLLQKK